MKFRNILSLLTVTSAALISASPLEPRQASIIVASLKDIAKANAEVATAYKNFTTDTKGIIAAEKLLKDASTLNIARVKASAVNLTLEETTSVPAAMEELRVSVKLLYDNIMAKKSALLAIAPAPTYLATLDWQGTDADNLLNAIREKLPTEVGNTYQRLVIPIQDLHLCLLKAFGATFDFSGCPGQ
jgi:hypothetical protein